MNTAFFKNPGLQKKFEENGFVKFMFLTEKQRNELAQLYAAKKPDMEFRNGLHISVDSFSTEEKGELKTQIMSIVNESIELHFGSVSHLHHGFIIKKANSPQTEISAHQDWTFVAEDEGLNSATFWIAVEDVPKIRGGIGFISGSHNWLNHTRYTPMELAYNPINEHRDLLGKYLVFEDLKAGEAILWNHRTLHGSVANSSANDRVVAAMSIIPESAQLKLHYKLPNKKDEVGIFDVDLEFYQRHRATDFHKIYEQNNCPEGLVPESTYTIQKRQFDAEKLNGALMEIVQRPIESSRILVDEMEAATKEKVGFWSRLKHFIFSKDA